MEETPRTISEPKAFSRMANLCARKECCVFDIKTKLMRYNLEPDVIEKIIDELKQEKYIDELRFTRSSIPIVALYVKRNCCIANRVFVCNVYINCQRLITLKSPTI